MKPPNSQSTKPSRCFRASITASPSGKWSLLEMTNEGNHSRWRPTRRWERLEVSLMTRLVKTGVPMNMLVEQYRMHPHIADNVSNMFYDSQLINAPSVKWRPEYTIWQTFHHETLLRLGVELRHSEPVPVLCESLCVRCLYNAFLDAQDPEKSVRPFVFFTLISRQQRWMIQQSQLSISRTISPV